MRKFDDDESIHRIARAAIDEEVLEELLEALSENEYEREAVDALTQVLADDIVCYLLQASNHARRRGRTLTGDDIGDAADRCCHCDDDEGPPSPSVAHPYIDIEN